MDGCDVMQNPEQEKLLHHALITANVSQFGL